MIQLSRRGAALYQMLSLVVCLLLVYAVGFLLSALFQLPGNPMAGRVDVKLIDSVTTAAFTLLLLTGLVCGGMAMGSLSLSARGWKLISRMWPGLILAHIAASVVLSGALADALAAAALLCLVALSWRSGEKTAFMRVWQLSLLLICLSLIAAHVFEGDLQLAIQQFQLHVAGGMGGLSLAFWLVTRLGEVDGEWARDGVRIVAGLLFFAGSLSSLAALGYPLALGIAVAPLILLAYMILAAHLARGLRWRRDDYTLAGHWLGLATLFWLTAGGILGAATAQTDINSAMRGTALQWTGDWIYGWALLSVVCALVNVIACELRGSQRRVTGYAPLWLVAFGVAFSSIVGRDARRAGDVHARYFRRGERGGASLAAAIDGAVAAVFGGGGLRDSDLCAGVLGAASADPGDR